MKKTKMIVNGLLALTAVFGFSQCAEKNTKDRKSVV